MSNNKITFQDPVHEYVSVAAENTTNDARRICEVAMSGTAGYDRIATDEGATVVRDMALSKIKYLIDNNTDNPSYSSISSDYESLLEVVADNGKYYMQWAPAAFAQVTVQKATVPHLSVINVNHCATVVTDASLGPGDILVTTAMRHGRDEGCIERNFGTANPYNISYTGGVTIEVIDDYSFLATLTSTNFTSNHVLEVAKAYAEFGAAPVTRNKFVQFKFPNGNKSFFATLLPDTADFATGQNGQALLIPSDTTATTPVQQLARYYGLGMMDLESNTLQIYNNNTGPISRSWNVHDAETGSTIVIANGKDELLAINLQDQHTSIQDAVSSSLDGFYFDGNQITYIGDAINDDFSTMVPQVYHNGELLGSPVDTNVDIRFERHSLAATIVEYHPVTLERGIDETVNIRIGTDGLERISVSCGILMDTANSFTLPSVTPFLVGDNIIMRQGPNAITTRIMNMQRVAKDGTTRKSGAASNDIIVDYEYTIEHQLSASGVYTVEGTFTNNNNLNIMERFCRITRNSSLMYLIRSDKNYCFCGDGSLILDNFGINGKKTLGHVRLLSSQENDKHVASNVAGKERTVGSNDTEILHASSFASAEFTVPIINNTIDLINNNTTLYGDVTTLNNLKGQSIVRLRSVVTIGKTNGVFPRLVEGPDKVYPVKVGADNVGSSAYNHQNNLINIHTVYAKSTSLFASSTERMAYEFEWDSNDVARLFASNTETGERQTMVAYGPKITGSISLSVDTGSVCKLVNENPMVSVDELEYFYTGIGSSPIDLFTFHITNPLTMLPLDGSYKIGVSTDNVERFGFLVDTPTGMGVQLQKQHSTDNFNDLYVNDKILFTFEPLEYDAGSSFVSEDLDIKPRGPFQIKDTIETQGVVTAVVFDTKNIHGESSPLTTFPGVQKRVRFFKYDDSIMRDITSTAPTTLTDNLRFVQKSNLDGKMEILVQSTPHHGSNLPSFHNLIVMETKQWGNVSAEVVVPFSYSQKNLLSAKDNTHQYLNDREITTFLPISLYSSSEEELVLKFYIDDVGGNIPYRSDFTLSGNWSDNSYTAHRRDNRNGEIINNSDSHILSMTVTGAKPVFSFSTTPPVPESGGPLQCFYKFSSGDNVLNVRVEYVEYPEFYLSDKNEDTFSVVCETPEIIQHVQLSHYSLNRSSTTNNISHIEETAFSGSQVTVSLRNGDRNIKELWEAWGNTYQVSTTLKNNSIALHFELTGSDVDVLFGTYTDPTTDNTHPRNYIVMGADGSEDDVHGNGIDQGDLRNTTSRFGNYKNIDGSPSAARVVSYFTERIRDHTSKSIDQIEIEVATDIAASLSALCESTLGVSQAFVAKGKIVHCMIDAENLQIENVKFRNERLDPDVSINMTYKITLNSTTDNDVRINFVNLQTMVGTDMPLSHLNPQFSNTNANGVAEGINYFFNYIGQTITTQNNPNGLPTQDIGYAIAESNTVLYVTINAELNHVPLWFKNADNVTVEALYGNGTLMHDLVNSRSAATNDTSAAQAILTNVWIPAMAAVCDVEETNVSSIVESEYGMWINTRGKPITVVSPGYSDVLTSSEYDNTLLTFNILERQPEGVPGLEDPLSLDYGLGSYRDSAIYELTPTYHAVNTVVLEEDNDDIFELEDIDEDTYTQGESIDWNDQSPISLRVIQGLDTSDVGPYSCVVRYDVYSIPTVTSSHIVSNNNDTDLTIGMLPYNLLQSDTGLLSQTFVHRQAFHLTIANSPTITLQDYDVHNTVHLPDNRASIMTCIKVSVQQTTTNWSIASGDGNTAAHITAGRIQLASDNWSTVNTNDRYIQVHPDLPAGNYSLVITAFGNTALFGNTGSSTLTIQIKVGNPVPTTTDSATLKIVAATVDDAKNRIYAVTGDSYSTGLTNSMGWPIDNVHNLDTNLSFNTDAETGTQTLTLDLDAVNSELTSDMSTQFLYAYHTYNAFGHTKNSHIVPFPLVIKAKGTRQWLTDLPETFDNETNSIISTLPSIDANGWYTEAFDMKFTTGANFGTDQALFTDPLGLVSNVAVTPLPGNVVYSTGMRDSKHVSKFLASDSHNSYAIGNSSNQQVFVDTWVLNSGTVVQVNQLKLTFTMDPAKFTGTIAERYLLRRSKVTGLGLDISYPQTQDLNNKIVSYDHTNLYYTSKNGEAQEFDFDVHRPIVHFVYYPTPRASVQTGPVTRINLPGEDLKVSSHIITQYRVKDENATNGLKRTLMHRLDTNTNRGEYMLQKQDLFTCVSVNMDETDNPITDNPITDSNKKKNIFYREQIIKLQHVKDGTMIDGIQTIRLPNVDTNTLLFTAQVTPRIKTGTIMLTRIMGSNASNSIMYESLTDGHVTFDISTNNNDGSDTITCHKTDSFNVGRGVYYLSYDTFEGSGEATRTVGNWWLQQNKFTFDEDDNVLRSPSLALTSPVLSIIRTNLASDNYAIGKISQRPRLVTYGPHATNINGAGVEYTPNAQDSVNLHEVHDDKLYEVDLTSKVAMLEITHSGTSNSDRVHTYRIKPSGGRRFLKEDRAGILTDPRVPYGGYDDEEALEAGAYYFVPVEDFDTLGHVGIMNMGGKFNVAKVAENASLQDGQVATVDGPKTVFESPTGTRPHDGTTSLRVYCFLIEEASKLTIKRVESLSSSVTHLRFLGLNANSSTGYVYDALVHEEGEAKHHRMVFGFSTHGLPIDDPKVFYDTSTVAPDNRDTFAQSSRGDVRVGCNSNGNKLFRVGQPVPRSRMIDGDTEYIIVENDKFSIMPHEDYKKVYVDNRDHFPTDFAEIEGLN